MQRYKIWIGICIVLVIVSSIVIKLFSLPNAVATKAEDTPTVTTEITQTAQITVTATTQVTPVPATANPTTIPVSSPTMEPTQQDTPTAIPTKTIFVVSVGEPQVDVSSVLDGKDTIIYYYLPITVQNTLGDGWNLQITAAPLTDAQGNSLQQTVNNVTKECVDTCTLPIGDPAFHNVVYPVIIGKGRPETILSAAPKTGKGKIKITAKIGIFIPASAKAASYTSQATISLAAGP